MVEYKPELNKGTYDFKNNTLHLSCGCWFEFDSGTYDLFESSMCELHAEYFGFQKQPYEEVLE